MTLPAFLLAFFISTMFGALFHVWKDGGIGKLFLYLIFSWLGFTAGQILGNVLGWTFFRVGPLNLGMAILGSLIFLYAGAWLARIQGNLK
jgi:hypothetical protein